jgi:uncharacterized protein YycO
MKHKLTPWGMEVKKVLIIGPLRVVNNTWPSELEKWNHLKELKYSVITGSKEERLEALKADADIYLINRENVDWLVNKSGLPFDYDIVVIDELSKLI